MCLPSRIPRQRPLRLAFSHPFRAELTGQEAGGSQSRPEALSCSRRGFPHKEEGGPAQLRAGGFRKQGQV